MFDLNEVDKYKYDPNDKAIHIKIAPGTEDWARVMNTAGTLKGVKPVKVARLLLRVGYLAFLKSERRRALDKTPNEGEE